MMIENPTKTDLKNYFESKKYSFDFEAFYDAYKSKKVNNWFSLMDTCQKNGLYISSSKQKSFTTCQEEDSFDYDKHYDDVIEQLFPDPKVRSDLELERKIRNRIMNEWNAQGRHYTAGDLWEEMERRKTAYGIVG